MDHELIGQPCSSVGIEGRQGVDCEVCGVAENLTVGRCGIQRALSEDELLSVVAESVLVPGAGQQVRGEFVAVKALFDVGATYIPSWHVDPQI